MYVMNLKAIVCQCLSYFKLHVDIAYPGCTQLLITKLHRYIQKVEPVFFAVENFYFRNFGEH